MKHKKRVIGLVVFALIVALFLVDPMTYTDFFNGYRLERNIRNNKFKAHHFSLFRDISSYRANKILLEHGDKLLEMGFHQEIIELEDLNDDRLNLLIAEAYYLEWLHSYVEESPYFKDYNLVYADKLAEGKVDDYFMPLLMQRSVSDGLLHERKDYVTEDYRVAYNELLAKEISNSIVHVIDSEVIYSRDSHLWWVPEGISIIHEKDLAIKIFLEELKDVNKDCFDRTIYHLLNSVRGIDDYLEGLDIYKYYNQPVGKVDFIQREGQLLNIDGVPYLYIKGEKYNDQLDRLQSGYFKINLDTGESVFYEASSQVIWREDGQYAFSIKSEITHGADIPFRHRVEVRIFNEQLNLIDTIIYEDEFINVSWHGKEIFIDEWRERKIYDPDSKEIQQGKFEEYSISYGGQFYGLIISPLKLSKGFSYYCDEGNLIFTTEKFVITDSLIISHEHIIYQTLDDIGIYIYSIKENELSLINTTSKIITYDNSYLYVLKFIDDYTSVLSKMDLSGEIVETYSFYNDSELIQSKGTKLLDTWPLYGRN